MVVSFLLNEAERERFNAYTTPRSSKSLTQRYIFDPVFRRLATCVPQNIGPNLLSLASALVLVQGWYVTENHRERFPTLSAVFVGAAVLLWYALDSIDQFHAENIGNDYSFVQLFDAVCSSIASIFLCLTLGQIFLSPDLHAQWYLTQIVQMFILNKHVQALRRGRLEYSRTRGPGEAVVFVLFLLAIRTFVLGNGTFDKALNEVVLSFVPSVGQNYPNAPPYLAMLVLFHFIEHVYFFLQTFVMVLDNPQLSTTRNLLQLSVILLYLPSVADALSRYLFDMKDFELFNVATIISDALTLSVLTCDVIVSRMAARDLHPTMPLFALVSITSTPLTVALASLYFIDLFFELSYHLKCPILGVIRNVYVDGIFDMVHIGHMKHFKRAASLGTRLFVGVVNDADATPYKRKPIMTHDERCEVVQACKYVYKVIPNAPCVKGGLNEEFLKKHSIHIVGCGEEYNTPEDEWYGIPRRLGMTRVLPRTQGMSTSDLIARIKQRSDQEGREIMS